jgi:hypothetical protein
MLVTFLVAAALVVFALRLLLALFGVEEWAIGWQIVDAPTGLLVSPVARLEPFDRVVAGRLTLADLAVALVVLIVCMFALSALVVRRAR